MSRRPVTQKKKKFIGKGIRMQILAWISLAGSLLLISSTFAWYSIVKREADSKTTNVMQPYYLTLLNPSETARLQLSVGSLMPGQTKQIVFCVSNNDNEEKINMGGADFDYSMELIYTNNLALKYSIYELEEAIPDGDDNISADIVAEDMVTIDGTVTSRISHWNIKGTNALERTEVSSARHVEVGLTEENSVDMIINRGTYWEYTKDSADQVFHLSSGTDGTGYDSQYFLMEITWDDNAVGNFDHYDKETDMIYLLVKALQPEPAASSEVQQ